MLKELADAVDRRGSRIRGCERGLGVLLLEYCTPHPHTYTLSYVYASVNGNAKTQN